MSLDALLEALSEHKRVVVTNKLLSGSQRTPTRSSNTRALQKARRRYSVLAFYSKTTPPSCNCCGDGHLEFLTLEHIVPIKRKSGTFGTSGSSLIDWIIRHGFPPGFGTLCYNCNNSRGNIGYCPHELEKVSNTTTITTVIGAELTKAVVESPPSQTSVGCAPVAGECIIGSTNKS